MPSQQSGVQSNLAENETDQRVMQKLLTPTHAQCEAFVEYICAAHSWYKHLPRSQVGSLYFS